jgi:hypothetical protein
MRTFLIAVTVFTFSTAAFSFGEPKHSKVEVTSSESDKEISFNLKVIPNEELKITHDAPWNLTIKNEQGIAFANSKFVKADMDGKLPGYKISSKSKPTSKAGSFDYKLVSFVCTKDKTSCYREVHKGTHKWTSK